MRITRETTRRKKTTTEVAFAISSKHRGSFSAKQALEAIRGHWGIEIRLHWIRDAVFGEDACRVRSGSAPRVLAALRNSIIARFQLAGIRSLTEELESLSLQPSRAVDYVTRRSRRVGQD
jgi:predicted transposase YbfD/YdcC